MGDWEDVFGSCQVEYYGDDVDNCSECNHEISCKQCKKNERIEHWKNRNSSRPHSINTIAIELARELVLITNKIEKLREKERGIRNEILTQLNFGEWILVESNKEINKDYIVEYVSHRQRPGLKRDITLKFIRRKFGIDAANLIEENCSNIKKPTKTIYVRPFQRCDDSMPQKDDEEPIGPDQDKGYPE